MPKTRISKQEKQDEALRSLRKWAFATGMTLVNTDLKHRIDWLHAWLLTCPDDALTSVTYHERLALFDGYFDAAEKRGLVQSEAAP